MKINYTLVTLFTLLLAGFSFGQQVNQNTQTPLSSDDPSFYTETSGSYTSSSSTCAPCETKVLSFTSTVLPCGGGIDTLVASGECDYLWSTDPAVTNVVSTTDSLITGTLTADTTFYLSSLTGQMDSLAPLPTQGGTFTGNVRGYYFIAPMDFLITGLRVPTEANTGAQNIAVLKFDNQTPPPLFSSNTNAFTELGYWNNYTGSDTISVCFAVDSGDVIGIYGNRGDVNSYGTSPYQSMIGGVPVMFTRSGMQQPLSANPMANVWTENGGSISRVQMFYDVTPDTLATIPVAINVPEIYTIVSDVAICAGDSVWAGGAWQTADGTYMDILLSVDGCDSTQTTNVTVNALPIVTFIGDSMCLQSGSVPLAGGSPAGGTYTGTNVSGNNFDATAAGAGTHNVVYTYTDALSCSNTANANVTVLDCASIGENTLEGVSFYPNPVSSYISIVLPENIESAIVTLLDTGGKLVKTLDINSSMTIISLEGLSHGMYVLELQAEQKIARYKLIKK